MGRCVSIATFGQSPQQKPQSGPLIDDEHPLMQVEQVALSGTTQIFGELSGPGLYIVRSHLAANATTRPRYHDQDRWVTVLKGTWWVGQGDMFKTDKLVPIREGGVMYLPASTRHFDVAASGDVSLQIMGNGPVKTIHAEVDATGVAVPIGGPYPGDVQPERGRGRGRGGRGGRRGTAPPVQ